MTKTLKNKNLVERSGRRALLAISLCASMAVFGCTTDRTLGNGDPVVTPGVRTSPTGATTGSESEPVPPPMMSSSAFTPRAILATPAQAAALMAAQSQTPRVRVLGPASPNSGGRAYTSDAASSAQPVYGGQATVNSSINGQQAAPGILSGAGEPIGGDPEVIDGFLDTIGATDPNTPTVVPPNLTTGTGVGASSSVAPTPTGAASGAPLPGSFGSLGTLSPTAATVINPPPSISGSPTLAAQSSARTGAGTTPTTATPSTTTLIGTNSTNNTSNANGTRTTAATTRARGTNVIGTNGTQTNATNSGTTNAGAASVSPTNVTVTNPVRVIKTNGRVVITNDSTSRNQ